MHKSKQNIFRVFMQSYLLLLVLPVVMGLLVGFSLVQLRQKDVLQRNETLTRQVIVNFETQLDNIQKKLLDISFNIRVRQFLLSTGKNGSDVDVSQLSGLFDVVPSSTGKDSIVDMYAIHCANINAIMTNDAAMLRLDQGYSQLFKFGDYSYEDWYAKVLSQRRFLELQPAANIMMNDQARSRILFGHSIVDYASGVLLGQVFAFINVKDVEELMTPTLDLGASILMISDAQGGLLGFACQPELEKLRESFNGQALNQSQTASLLGKQVLFTQITSDQFGLVYTMIVPRSSVWDQVIDVVYIMLSFILLLIFIGSIVSLLIARHQSRPYIQLADRLKQSSALNDDICDSYQINYAISNLILKQQELESKVESQETQLVMSGYLKLVRGWYLDEKEMFGELPNLRAQTGPFFGIVMELDESMIDISEESWLKLARTICEDALDKMSCVVFYSAMSLRRIAFLTVGDAKKIMSLLESVIDHLKQEYKINVRCGMGDPVNQLLECSHSFHHAEQILDEAYINNRQPIVCFSKSSYADQFYRYDAVDSRKLMTLSIAGKFQELADVLKGIYEINYVERRIGTLQSSMLIAALTDTFLRLLNSISVVRKDPDNYKKLMDIAISIPDGKVPEQVFKLLYNAFEIVCNLAEANKKSHNTKLAQDILKYLEENYKQYDLCLSSVSTKFGLSERYLSIFFREQNGESFTDCILRIRINKANELLCKSGLTISEIAKTVGYISPDTFRKAYKRHMGYNPSLYRE